MDVDPADDSYQPAARTSAQVGSKARVRTPRDPSIPFRSGASERSRRNQARLKEQYDRDSPEEREEILEQVYVADPDSESERDTESLGKHLMIYLF